VVRSLARPTGSAVNQIESISLLGYDGKLQWKQTADGLFVTMPEKKVSEYTAALKITGSSLTNVPYTTAAAAIGPDARGRIVLSPVDADLHGEQIAVENQGGQPNIGFWDNPADSASWKVQFPKPGRYAIKSACAATADGGEFVVEIAGRQLIGRAEKTGAWDKYAEVNLGLVEIKKAGEQTVRLRARDAVAWRAINVRALRLTPVKPGQ